MTICGSGENKYTWVHGTTEQRGLEKKNGTASRSTTDGVDLPQGTHAKGLYCKAMCSYTIEGNPAGLAQVIVNFAFHGKNLSSIIR